MTDIERVRAAATRLRLGRDFATGIADLLDALATRAEEITDSMPGLTRTVDTVLAGHLTGWTQAVALAHQIWPDHEGA